MNTNKLQVIPNHKIVNHDTFNTSLVILRHFSKSCWLFWMTSSGEQTIIDSHQRNLVEKTCSSQQPAQWHAGEHSGCWWCTTGNHLVACRPSDDIALGLNISGIDNWRCHGRNDISRDRGNITCGNYKEDFIWIDKQNQQRNSFIGLSIYNLSWSTKYIDSVTIVPHAWHEHNIYSLQCSHW